MKPDTQVNLMRRYLLGDLQEPEINELEIEVLRDNEAFDQLWEIENRLVDNYVRGRLSAADRERFEHHYQSSPIHRQRVAVARNLVAEADGFRAAAIPGPAKVSWAANLSEKLGFALLSWQSALVTAALLLAICSLWLFLDRSHLRQSQEQLRAESEARQNREQVLSQQLSQRPGRRTTDCSPKLNDYAPEQNAKSQTPNQSQPTPQPTIYSLLLSPMLMRGGEKPQTATIPRQTEFVRLQMKAEQEHAGRFHVSVRTVEGRLVWEQQVKLNARNSIITAQMPAGRLPVGDYILTLSASNPTGQPEEINRYFFRVIGP